MSDRASVLFVDDEKRVLNSMRGMFRRDFDLFLTTEGATAVKIASENSIDVIVADQRMPGMTGIEVLQKVRELSPGTIRILLTGYADPSAVADSINVGEVYRFLDKPCPPKLLRETLELAVTATRSDPDAIRSTATTRLAGAGGERDAMRVARNTASRPAGPPVLDPPARSGQSRDPSRARREPSALRRQRTPQSPRRSSDDALIRWHSATRAALAANSQHARNHGYLGTRITAPAREVGAVVYTVDARFAETVIRTLSPDRSTTLATSLLKMLQAIEQDTTGVLIADVTSDKARLIRVVGALKKYRPELVTIVVSDSEDTTDMVRLINFGQVFRYGTKPVGPEQLRVDVDDAALKHIDLVNNPKSVIRHSVVDFPIERDDSTALNRILSRIQDRRSTTASAKDGHY